MEDELTFGGALGFLKDGGRIRRRGWNGAGMWLCLIKAGNAMHLGYPMKDCIAMKTANGDMQPGWLASQADMLSNDWELVEGEENA